MKEIYEMHGRGHSARAIARELGLARNTVLRCLDSPEAMFPKPRPPRGSKLDSHTEYIDQRLAEGLENCAAPAEGHRAQYLNRGEEQRKTASTPVPGSGLGLTTGGG